MTDVHTPQAETDAEGVDWGTTGQPEAVAADGTAEFGPYAMGATPYPEPVDNPHNHRYTISFTGSDAPMIVVRGNTAADITSALNELEAYGVYANIGAAHASLKAQGAIGQGLGPVTPVTPQAPPPGLPQGPPMGMPPGVPNQFGANPQAPGFQGPFLPNAPQAGPPPGQWQPPQQQGGGWGGNAGGGQGNSRDPKPRPAGWFMVDVPFNDKDRFKGLRAQGSPSADYLRGKIQWGGKGVYWLEPSIAQWVAQQNFPVIQ